MTNTGATTSKLWHCAWSGCNRLFIPTTRRYSYCGRPECPATRVSPEYAQTGAGYMVLTYQETASIPVPSQYWGILGTTPRTVPVYTDRNGSEWRPSQSSQPFRCNGCGEWRSGQYWSHPPVYLCAAHVTVTGE